MVRKYIILTKEKEKCHVLADFVKTELSNSTYDASISKLVNAAIEDLITTKNVALYKKENTNQVSRSFLIREDFLNGLYELKENYSVSINSLVNIAIRNAVTEEKMETKGLDKLK